MLEVEIIPGKANRASPNRAPLRRARDLLGALRVVIFSPEDLAIVKGDPAERRRFLDELITARWPRLAGVRADYERVLRQRSTLLKSLAGRGPRALTSEVGATLDVWDESLATLGAEIVAARLVTLAELSPLLAEAYADIAPTNNVAAATYRSSAPVAAELTHRELAGVLGETMRDRRSEEIARGVCLVGPHRDDITFSLGDLPAKGYASHGESWSMALALRLASFALLRADGVQPVLVLDDVFAEIGRDPARAARRAGRRCRAGADHRGGGCRRAHQPGRTALRHRVLDRRTPGGGIVTTGGPPEHDPTGSDLARQIARAARGGPPPTPRRRRSPERSTDDPAPIGEVLKEVIGEQGWSTEVNLHHLLGRWEALVGPVNAADSAPESYADKVLIVRAESTTWATSLRQISPRLVAILNEHLGQGTVERVLVLGPEAPNWKKGRRSVPGRGPRDTYG